MSDFLGGKLDNQEIRQKLLDHKYTSGFKPTNKLIDSIIEKFWFHDFYNSFLSDEIYLKLLTEFLDKEKPNSFNRYTFYKYFFDQVEGEENGRNILQQIALEFEKQQSDAITPNEYTLLLQKVSAPAGKFDTSWMENHHLGKVKERDNKELFVWEHHTLTEFLVTEYLLESEAFLEEFQKLSVLGQEGITAFKPSWSGVLRFLMESKEESKVIPWLVGFLEKYPDNLDDNLTELLVYKATEQTPKIKNRIFKLVYESYFKRIVWLPVWARNRLSKLVDEKSYKRLKEDIKEWPSKTETFVRRGNIASIIEGLLENKSNLLTKTERKFWRTKLIDFANNPNDDGNGVLQRHSLGALALFKDYKIISLVSKKCFKETRDTLVRDEFIQFCYNSAPNSKAAIDNFIEGVKKGSTIYGRHGLYQITARRSIEYLLSKVSLDEQFLKVFLEHESIFDKDGADKELIKNIETQISPKVLGELKKIIFTVLRIDSYYKEDQSNFLHQIIKIISKHDSSYLFELLEDIKKEADEQKIDRLFYDSKELLALLLTQKNVEQYFKTLENFPDRTKRDTRYPVYIAKRLNGDIGELVYQKAVKLGLVEKVDEGYSQKYTEELQQKRRKDTYKSFLHQLEPESNKYMPSVFKYFLESKKEIEEQWKEKDKKRLHKLAVDDGIKKIDPSQFKVKINSRHEGNSQFTWTASAAYYGDILDVVKEIAPDEIKPHRQNIINFIPYEFGTGSTLNFIKELQDKELEWVNKVMSDKKDDRRYLIPQTYIYLVGEYAKGGSKLPSVKAVLKSFIDDSDIQEHNQTSALENLVYFIDKSDTETKNFLEKIFNESKNQKLAKIANGLLITVYREEEAINWRFKKLKEPLPFEGREMDGMAHEVGPIEDELDTMALAHPLIELRDEKYLQHFLDLLDFSFNVPKDKQDKKYSDYVSYLWRIIITFVEKLKENGSFIPLLELENWVDAHTHYENLNWLRARVKEIKHSYINYVHPYDKLIDGVEGLSKINIPAAQIAYFLFKAQVVETELRKLIEGINYFLEKANNKLPIYRKENQDSKNTRKQSTLGQLKNDLNNYQGKSIEKLKAKLSLFYEKRNEFTHQLFQQNKSMYELGQESTTYTKHAEDSLELIQEVWKDILKVK